MKDGQTGAQCAIVAGSCEAGVGEHETSVVRKRPGKSINHVRELDAEWDPERTLETMATSFTINGLLLGATVDRRWLASQATQPRMPVL